MKRIFIALIALCGLPLSSHAEEAARTALLLDGLGVYVANSYVGVSTLAGPLQQQGYRTVVDTHFMRKSNGELPSVIIGHSMGGSAALSYATRLVQAGYPAPLVITIDAAIGSPPCGVPRCINIHSPGFPDIVGAQNIDAWRSGANMVNHAMLATNPAIQRLVLQFTATLMAQYAAPQETSAMPLPPPSPRRVSGSGG